jgi:photosystem II stability/assembly factor-like uncharacterized protein/TolA-binding protein
MLGTFVLALLLALPGATDVAAGDARLNDLCFVDDQCGWAVGDRGVIWHTDDGGRQWNPQNSGVNCSLWAIHFHNKLLGWAAGGFTHPYTHESTGVLLTTRDGGQTWAPIPKLVLPTLRRIGFFDARRGWAAGYRSAMYPSGVFLTDDGGQSWRPIPGAAGTSWPAADFLDPHTGIVAGRNGSLAVVRGNEIEPVRTDGLELRSFAQARFGGKTGTGWFVGEGGLVLATADLGASWHSSNQELPKAAEQFDFAAVAARGSNCWIAGSPGTCVFHTFDAGRTWTVSATGSSVPLRALSFIDDMHGWAAGELGTILASDDGGKTWRLQRSGGRRAALLAILPEPEDVPLELLAKLAGNEGYLSAVETIGRRDMEIAPRDDVPLADRLHEAVVRVGGCSAGAAWQFPLRQAGLRIGSQKIVEAWDSKGEGRGMEELHARLVRQIRLWRPDVLVTCDAGGEAADPLVALVHQAVLAAVEQAADPKAFPEQIAEAGLSPWQVKKVYTAMPPGSRGVSDLVTSQFAPGLGRSLDDVAAEPRGLLHDDFSLSPPSLGFRLTANRAASESDRRDFFSGLSIPPGSESRRPMQVPATEKFDLGQRTAKKRRNVQAILEHAGRSAGSSEHLLAQMDELTRDLDGDSAGQVLYQLAGQFARQGRWQEAADAFQSLADRYPQHSLAPPALLWLLRYYASGEAARRTKCNAAQLQKRFERAAAIGREIERTRFTMFSEPDVRFPLAAAYRGLGQPRQADRLYQIQNRCDDRDAWWTCAQGELRMADPKNMPIKTVLPCVRAGVKPRLDGLLDDPVWKKAKSASLQSAQHDDGDWPAAVMLAYDSEFLYIAAYCRSVPSNSAEKVGKAVKEVGMAVELPSLSKGATIEPPTANTNERLQSPHRQQAPSPTAPRPRNSDLSAHDRIEVLLDIDRDYSTYYRLAVDHRGWTNDRCWDDDSWDPAWFVASKQEDGSWTVEAAIPLSELTDRPPKPRDIWAVGIQRVVPGAGFQSWTTPASAAVLPDGFGYLVFE